MNGRQNTVILQYRYGTHHAHLSERFSNVPSTPTTAVGECMELVEPNTLFNCCIAPSLDAIVSRISAQLAVRLIINNDKIGKKARIVDLLAYGPK